MDTNTPSMASRKATGASVKRTKTPSKKKRDDTQQREEERQQKRAKAVASATRAETRQQNQVHDPSPSEIQARINDPDQQASREAAARARYQDPTPTTQLSQVRADKRALHTNQLAMQMHESRRVVVTQAQGSINPRGSGEIQPIQAQLGVDQAVRQTTLAAPDQTQHTVHLPPASGPERPLATTLPHPRPPAARTQLPPTLTHSRSQHLIQHPVNITLPTPAKHATSGHVRPQNLSRPLDRKAKKQLSNQKRPALGKLADGRTIPVAKAVEYYGSYVMSKDPLGLLPSEHFGTSAMSDACRKLGMEVSLTPTKSELKIMSRRNSNLRKPYLDSARRFAPPLYGLLEPFGNSYNDTKRLNQRTVERLVSEAHFVHEDHQSAVIKPMPYMSPIFYAILKDCAFKTRQSSGVQHSEIWTHASLEFLAFLATLVEKVLYEWSTGERVETPLAVDSQDLKRTYYGHLDKLKEQHKACPPIMDMHCRNLVKNARDALGSGPNLSQRPESGATSASIAAWARHFALLPSTLTSQSEHSQTFSQYANSGPGSYMDTFSGGLAPESELTLPSTQDESQFSQYEFQGHSYESQGSRGDIYPFDNAPSSSSELSNHPAAHDSQPSGSRNLANPLPYCIPLQNTFNPDTQTESEVSSYVATQPLQLTSQVNRINDLVGEAPPTPANDHNPVVPHIQRSHGENLANQVPYHTPAQNSFNPDTQTESEVDSYVTIRPSQSISQVNRALCPINRATSPPTPFEQQTQTWLSEWVESRSVSQSHAEEFNNLYPLPQAGSTD